MEGPEREEESKQRLQAMGNFKDLNDFLPSAMFRIIRGGMLSERVMAPQCSVNLSDALCPGSAPTLLQRNVAAVMARRRIKEAEI
ncbi:hypothetical protein SUGI_0040100 [Cryptomeria japonica]|nr:hypothetical protein SUGI_0040100 [Cryptomeria japonica]